MTPPWKIRSDTQHGGGWSEATAPLKGNSLVVDRTSVPEPLVSIFRVASLGTAPHASLGLGTLVGGPSCWRDGASQHVNGDKQRVANEMNEVYECFLLWVKT